MELTRRRVISSILVWSILITSFVMFSEKTIQLINYAKSLLQNFGKDIDNSMGNEERELDELKSRLDTMNETFLVGRIEDFLQKLDHIRKVLREYQQRVEVQLDYNYPKAPFIFSYMEEIEYLYKEYIQNLRTEVINDTLCNFAQSVTSNNGGDLGKLLEIIGKHVKSEEKSLSYWSFFGIAKDYFMELVSRHCGQASIQQSVYELCRLLIHSEKIAYLVFKRSYRQLTECSEGNYTNEMKLTLGGIVRRIRDYIVLISTVIADLPREVRRCGPRGIILNEDFFELERVVRIIPMSGMQMSPSRECATTCDEIIGQPRLGETLDSSYKINMTYCDSCMSAMINLLCRAPPNTSPYFDGIHEIGGRFPRRTKLLESSPVCKNRTQLITLNGNANHCHDCVCTCTNPDPDIKWRYTISLRLQESNTSLNMVVTGIRFKKINNTSGVKVIYPQIKVAKLLPEGLSKGFWKDAGNFDDGLWPSGKPGVDYAIIGKDVNQSMMFNLNENRAKPGYVVTGVKFQLGHNPYDVESDGRHKNKVFGLVVRLTPYDFITGNLSASESCYTYPDTEVASAFDENAELECFPRMNLYTTDKTVHENDENIRPDSESRQYIEISHTRIHVDFGQTTIPFFDLRSVDPEPAIPFSGMSLFYYNPWRDHEYLAFKVTTVNITELIKSPGYKSS